MKFRSLTIAACLSAVLVPSVFAWDYEGHRLVNTVAIAALPKEFPAFVREPANAERIAFLAGEPDRWRNLPDAYNLAQTSGMDHYLDMEELDEAGIALDKLPSFRFDFATQFAAGRAAHPENFPAIDPTKNKDHTREWPGFAPWAICENFAKLRSAFSYLRVFEELGTPEEIANARANILYVMGVMGHYVGDCSQPLHTTIHHHGWVGPNPNGYTNWYGIHAWLDGGIIGRTQITMADLAPQVETSLAISLAPRPDGRDPMFVAVVDYLAAQHKRVEEIYVLEKAGKLGRDEQVNRDGKVTAAAIPVSPEARQFVTHQLVVGGEMLAAIWTTAWRTSVPDTYLRKQLTLRQAAAQAKPAAPAAK